MWSRNTYSKASNTMKTVPVTKKTPSGEFTGMRDGLRGGENIAWSAEMQLQKYPLMAVCD